MRRFWLFQRSSVKQRGCGAGTCRTWLPAVALHSEYNLLQLLYAGRPVMIEIWYYLVGWMQSVGQMVPSESVEAKWSKMSSGLPNVHKPEWKSPLCRGENENRLWTLSSSHFSWRWRWRIRRSSKQHRYSLPIPLFPSPPPSLFLIWTQRCHFITYFPKAKCNTMTS